MFIILHNGKNMSKTLFLKQKNIVSSPCAPFYSQDNISPPLSKIVAYGSCALCDLVHAQSHSPQDAQAKL